MMRWDSGWLVGVGVVALLTGCGSAGSAGSDGTNDSASPQDTEVILDIQEDSHGNELIANDFVLKLSPDADLLELDLAVDAAGGQLLDPSGPLSVQLGFYHVRLPTADAANALSAQLKDRGIASSIEPNYVVPYNGTPNDPYLDHLWGMTRIAASEAWEISTGDPSIVVAVTDTGLDATHPDIVPNLFVNPDEIANNGLDDDGNGYVDDVSGWDFVGSDGAPTDEIGHGTHVAGTIAAAGNNGQGVTGVMWNASILPVRVCSSLGCDTISFAKGMLYAAESGAQIVNASLGGSHPPLSYEQDAISRLSESGVVLVAAAGNNGTDNDVTPIYPASYTAENIVSVAASDESDALASFSCFGRESVDLAAPGSNVLSCLPGGYGIGSGTSMAAPHVAGAMALYLAAHPEATALEARSALLASVDPVSSMTDTVVTGGRLNLHRLLDNSTALPPAVCGDGTVESGEDCDDGNDLGGDGCSSTCRVEEGFTCSVTGTECATLCGDGIVAGDEECDDSNDNPGDGCDETCSVEDGWICTVASGCKPSGCGDGVVGDDEACDDGNHDMGDGCTPFCELEPNCTNGECTSRCGDGIILPSDPEECDDGNNVDGDGCSATCMVEDGYDCSSSTEVSATRLEVPIVIRDFHETHPDMESTIAVDPGIVETALGADGKPVYAGGIQGTTHGQEAFDQWYRDATAVNTTVVKTLTLQSIAPNVYRYEDASFFPIDDEGFGNEGNTHNFHFTSEVRYWFEYQGGEELTFTGDDDVWVFINGQLVVDLGGVHSAQSDGVTMDYAGPPSDGFVLDPQTANELGLETGKVYEIVVFQAERHTTESHYRLTLSGFSTWRSQCEPLCGDGQLVGAEICDDGINDGSYGSCEPGCRAVAGSCGDGIVNGPEECDDGRNDATCGGCTTGCVLAASCCDANPCDVNATCTDEPRGYRCDCNDGYLGDGTTCEDLDECATGLHSCSEHADCYNEAGSYRCECHEQDGWYGNGFFCDDMDECAEGVDDCHPDATCKNMAPGYECECLDGYEGDGVSCVDVDECARGTDSCDTNAICENTKGGYACDCMAGFEGDGITCEDVNECEANFDDCPVGALCINLPGAFRCVCADGWVGDGSTCTNVDECAESIDECDPHADCHDTPGSYYCDCHEGYEGDGKSCTDIDECERGLDNCDPNATCHNEAGTFSCTCDDGWVGNGTSCTDVNECALGEHTCPADHSECINDPGDYHCSCAEGWESTGHSCADIDECRLGIDDCPSSAICVNTEGSYTCECSEGFAPSGTLCVDIDECAGDNPCGDGGTCVNTVGTYRCDCFDGYENAGLTCEDIDECRAPELNSCHTNAECTNLPGSYTCQCLDGYTGDGYGTCDDDNECALGTDRCDPVHADCLNLQGGYTCQCHSGYVGSGESCSPEDPCLAGTHDCDLNASCLSEGDGTYSCECNPGYAGSGQVCNDIDECADGSASCDPNATCTNTLGGFDCECNAGWIGNGTTCLEPDPDNPSPCLNNDCLPEATCEEQGAGYLCACPDGYVGDGRTSCEDIDECATGQDDCDVHATCTNTDGSFTCACDDPWIGDGVTCEDPDQCQDGTHDCDPNATCTDTSPGWACVCDEGFVGDGQTCADVDECADGSHTCDPNATCINTPGAYTCDCNDYYVGDGFSCDANECAAETDNCSPHAICANRAPGFACTCVEGYEGDGVTCTDVDECAAGTDDCDINANCTNTEPGFECTCKPGWYGDGRVCWDDPYFVVHIDSRSDHTCALLDNGATRCWGRNLYGQLGYGHTHDIGDDELAETASYVNTAARVSQVSAGVGHTCAVLEDGGVRCWGRNHYGQLGYPGGDDVGDDETPDSAPLVDVGEPVIQVVAGGEHTCALLVDGRVRCWGLGIDGQLGYAATHAIGDDESPASAGDVDLGGAATQLVAGRDHTCALMETGAVRCWGRGLWAPLGYGHTDSIGDDESPAQAGDVNLGGNAVQLTAGWYHTCALLDTGAVRCWGYNGVGQLGYGNTDSIGDDESPADAGDIDLGEAAIDVDAGLYHTCAVLTTGAVHCWGYGDSGRTGYARTCNLGDDETPAEIGAVDLGGTAVQVVAGFAHTCALLEEGDVKCWGDGEFGQRGTGNTDDIGDDEHPSGAPSILMVDVNECLTGDHLCDANATCLNHSGGYTCECDAGYEGDGFTCGDVDECDTGDHSCDTNATCANTIGSYTCECDAGFDGSGTECHDIDECALDACDPAADCTNLPGSYTCECRLGFVGDGEYCEPEATHVVDVVAGDDHTCALLNTGGVRCWGQNASGQLGYGHQEPIGDDETAALEGDVDVGGLAVQLTAGSSHTCALLDTGSVRCWGFGESGRLGYANVENVGDDETPAMVGDLHLGGPAIQIAAGTAHTCAVLTDGTVRCWGAGEAGRLGYASINSVGDDEDPGTLAPVDVGGPVVEITAGRHHTCARLASGGIRCWGLGLYGQLGYGNTLTIGDDEAPAAVGLVDLGGTATHVTAGDDHTCALLDDGTVRCWGYGEYGSLGYGNTAIVGDNETPSTVGPVALDGLAVDVVAGEYHTCALLDNGTARCWGYNSEGQLGLGTTNNVGDNELPTTVSAIDGGTPFVALAAGRQHTCALTATELYCWGNAEYGQLGYGTTEPLGDDESGLAGGGVPVVEF